MLGQWLAKLRNENFNEYFFCHTCNCTQRIQPGNWTVRASSKTGKIQVSGCHLCLDDNTHTFFDAVETKLMSAAGEKQIILGC
jgi:hypothetical protein